MPWFVASLRCMPQSCTTTNPNAHLSTGHNYHRNLRTQATCNLPRARIPKHELLQPCLGCRAGSFKMMRHKEQPQAVSIVARKEHKTPTMNDFNSHELKIATDRRCHYAISSKYCLAPWCQWHLHSFVSFRSRSVRYFSANNRHTWDCRKRESCRPGSVPMRRRSSQRGDPALPPGNHQHHMRPHHPCTADSACKS